MAGPCHCGVTTQVSARTASTWDTQSTMRFCPGKQTKTWSGPKGCVYATPNLTAAASITRGCPQCLIQAHVRRNAGLRQRQVAPSAKRRRDSASTPESTMTEPATHDTSNREPRCSNHNHISFLHGGLPQCQRTAGHPKFPVTSPYLSFYGRLYGGNMCNVQT